MVSGTHTMTGTVCVRRFLHAQRKRLVIDFWSCPIKLTPVSIGIKNLVPCCWTVPGLCLFYSLASPNKNLGLQLAYLSIN